MLAADIVLDDVSGDDSTYRLYKQDGIGASRIDIATVLSLPAYLTIKHSVSGKGADIVDRHLVSLTRTYLDSAEKMFTVTSNWTVAVPRTSAITAAMVADETARLIDFMSSGGLTTLASTANIEAILRGES